MIPAQMEQRRKAQQAQTSISKTQAKSQPQQRPPARPQPSPQQQSLASGPTPMQLSGTSLGSMIALEQYLVEQGVLEKSYLGSQIEGIGASGMLGSLLGGEGAGGGSGGGTTGGVVGEAAGGGGWLSKILSVIFK